MVEPNIQGFVDAEDRLRDKFGLDVRIFTPTPTTYAPGTVLDPQTARPYDPTIHPTASGFAVTTVRATVISGLDRSLLRAEDDTQTNALGVVPSQSVVLNITVPDWALASAATEFEVFDTRYEIRDAEPDGFAQRATRWLIFGERK